MVDLRETHPIEDLLPLAIGAARLQAMQPGALTSVSSWSDRDALSGAVEAAHGLALPDVGRSVGDADARCVWFGRNECLLLGPVPDADLARFGAIVDQSDAWCVVALSGATCENVLARLVPVDVRRARFDVGATLRTQLRHLNVSLTRIAPDRFMILAFRSMAGTLVHDLRSAMESVAARG